MKNCLTEIMNYYLVTWANSDKKVHHSIFIPIRGKLLKNCILSALKKDYARTLKNDKKYYIVRQNTSKTKYLFEVKNNPQHLFNNLTEVYPTTNDSMYVATHYGGFEKKTGRKINELVLNFCSTRITSSSRNLEISTSLVLNPNRAIPISTQG